MQISSTGSIQNMVIPPDWKVYPEGVLVTANAYDFMASGNLVDGYGNLIYSFIRYSAKNREHEVFCRKPDPDTLDKYSRYAKLKNIGLNRERDHFEFSGSYKDERVALFHARLCASTFQWNMVEDIREFKSIILRGDHYNLDIIMAIALMGLVNLPETIDFLREPTGIYEEKMRPAICFIGGYDLDNCENDRHLQQLQSRQTCYFEALWVRYISCCEYDVLKGVPFILADCLFSRIMQYKYTNGNGLYKDGVIFRHDDIYDAVNHASAFMTEEYKNFYEEMRL